MSEKKEIEILDKFNKLTNELNDKHFWKWVASWKDAGSIVDQYVDWDVEVKAEEIPKLEALKREQEDEIYDHIGTVTKGDFELYFKEDFIEKNFQELAHAWFRGMEAQVDFGIILDCIKDMPEFKEGLKNGMDS